MLINITASAEEYFKQIIACQAKNMKVNCVNLRIKAINIGCSSAGIELAYCLPGEEDENDIIIAFKDFILYVDHNSELALLNSVIDYKFDDNQHYQQNQNLRCSHNNKNNHKYINANGNGKLHIKAPYLYENHKKTENFEPQNENNSIFNEINKFIIEEINPWLARHKGMIKLIELYELNNGISISLEFSGGCKGCSMVQFTLKHNIEKLLKNKFKEIVLIKDLTEHVSGKNPYYID